MSVLTLETVYLLPMILGRSYDIRSHQVGPDLFPPDILDRVKVTPAPNFDSRFSVVTDRREEENKLGISGDLALLIKGGMVSIAGKGDYLRDIRSRDDEVAVLCQTSFTSVEIGLPPNAEPAPQYLRRADVGTHYVSRIKYGGELLANLKFRAHDRKDVTWIKGQVNLALQGSSSLDISAQGKLEKLQKELEGNASLEIEYFSNVPLAHIPRTLHSFFSLLKDFQNQVLRIDRGRGVPLRVELMAIVSDSRVPVMKNSALKTELSSLEWKLDELRTVRTELQDWVDSLSLELSPDVEARIAEFQREVETVLAAQLEAVAQLDVAAGLGQFDASRDAYKRALGGKGGFVGKKFSTRLNKLRKEITEKEPPEGPSSSPAVYTHWGHVNCPEVDETIISGGRIAASMQGDAVNYLCLPAFPKMGDLKDGGGEVAGVQIGAEWGSDRETALSPARCSVCQRTAARGMATMSSLDCPDGWSTVYAGLWASAPLWHRRSPHICLAAAPDAGSPPEMPKDGPWLVPAGSNSTVLPCVLCAR